MKIAGMLMLSLMMMGNVTLFAEIGTPQTWDGELSMIAVYVISAMAGLAGTWCWIAVWGTNNIQEMARKGSVNFILSVCLSPTACWMITKSSPITMNLILVVPVSLAIGIGGGLALKKYGPALLDRGAGKLLDRVGPAMKETDDHEETRETHNES